MATSTTASATGEVSRAQDVTLRVVTLIIGIVVGLTFLFGFGNVLDLGLRLGVPVWVAPLVAPEVDLSVLGLLLATRHLALAGVPAAGLRPARRLLLFASVTTLALNVADPLVAGEFGTAMFDAVGPLLLIGWAEVGPGLFKAMSEVGFSSIAVTDHGAVGRGDEGAGRPGGRSGASGGDAGDLPGGVPAAGSLGYAHTDESPVIPEALIARAWQEDVRHWAEHQRPISAETLRKELRVGAGRARTLVSIVRARPGERPPRMPVDQAAD